MLVVLGLFLLLATGASIAAQTPLQAAPETQQAPIYYLDPPNLHLVAGATGAVPLSVVDGQGNEVEGDVTFHGYDATLISISPAGYVTALRTEGATEIGTWVSATIDGQPAASTSIVRVLSAESGASWAQIVEEHTALYYPASLDGEALSRYVSQYEIPRVNEYVYALQHQLMGTRPFDGARQIFEVDFGESETQRVCGISGNPIRLGWNLNGNEWQNCFLVPFIPPRSPQWNVIYHEMGHNFTWASPSFGKGLGRFEYSEGLATAIAWASMQTILDEPLAYPLGTDAGAAMQQQVEMTRANMSARFQSWLQGGANFAELDPDIVDGIWLHHRTQRPADFAVRFFRPLQPRYAAWVSDVVDDIDADQQHTIFAALVSVGVGQDLSETFSSAYHYPLDPALFDLAYEVFGEIVDGLHAVYLPLVVR
jgi:hypothetical protein